MQRRFSGAIGGVALTALLAVQGAAPASAHHAINATVDTETEIVQKMKLTKIDWINPHSWFHFTMTTAKGKVVADVMMEWASLAGMRQAGYNSPNMFPLGDTFTVTYNPNRDGSPGGHMVRMTDDADGTLFDY